LRTTRCGSCFGAEVTGRLVPGIQEGGRGGHPHSEFLPCPHNVTKMRILMDRFADGPRVTPKPRAGDQASSMTLGDSSRCHVGLRVTTHNVPKTQTREDEVLGDQKMPPWVDRLPPKGSFLPTYGRVWTHDPVWPGRGHLPVTDVQKTKEQHGHPHRSRGLCPLSRGTIAPAGP
jgi:hypothetical protein